MLFSLAWLRELCPAQASPAEVAAALTARGLTVDALEPRGDDHALDVDVPANRGDCLGHLGLARELSAAFGVPLAPRPPALAPDDGTAAKVMRVEIDAPELCGRFTATVVRGVRVGPTSPRLAERLEVCGLRSINNVVDASNLVMLETGNPVHFYDLHRLNGGVIRARRARSGERLTTLDDVTHTLDDGMLLIADAERALGLAGIMGGADSEITDSTRDVLIEVAWFAPASVRRTARALGIKTDASHRFERCVDPEGPLAAQALSVRLLGELAAGVPEGGLIDNHAAPREKARLELRGEQLQRLLGYAPGPDETRDALEALGLAPEPSGDGVLTVSVPSWRSDLTREADLVEEVARHLGYDRIPAHRVDFGVDAPLGAAAAVGERARDLMAGLGFHEAFGYAMIADSEDAPFVWPGTPPASALTNPIAETMSHLRRSLLPGLLRSIERNVRRGVRDVRLFEVEHVFHDVSAEWLAEGHPGTAPQEPDRLEFVWTGSSSPRHWSGNPGGSDFYDAAGVIDTLLEGLAPGLALSRRPGGPEALHPGRSATWVAADGARLAWCGELHPSLAEGFDQTVCVGGVHLAALGAEPHGVPRFEPLPRLGSVSRDLAVVLPAEARFGDVLSALERVPAPAPVRFAAVDRYVGPPLADGESSLTVRVTLQPDRQTLTEAEIEGFRTSLVEALAALGLSIRS